VKAADTRERILRVARDAFSELGYDATTFQAVADRAGLTRPAINHYFSSKSLLYREVLERAVSINVIPAIERARHEAGLIGRLSSLIGSLDAINVADRSAGAFAIAAMLEAKRHPELRVAVSAAQASSLDFLTWAVTDAIESGELTTGADIPSLVEMLRVLLWGLQFYACFLGTDPQLLAVSASLRLLLANQLWLLSTPGPA
jgi:AcrR family transcriptional regulator